MESHIKQCFFLAYLLFITTNTKVLSKTYYVAPSIPCPEDVVPCFTLSQYAAKPNNYFASNSTLFLLPGNHSLDSELMMSNITSLKFVANSISPFLQLLSDTVVVCSPSARLQLEMIKQIQISRITFVGCMNNNVTRVDNFSLEDCGIQGQGCDGSGLILNMVSRAKLTRSLFSLNTGTKVHNPANRINKGGGSIIVYDSENVDIDSCTFINNTLKGTASAGGAIFAYSSIVTMYSCIFNSNSVKSVIIGAGGAVYAYNTTIVLISTTFTNNSVSFDVLLGGAGAVALYSSTIVVTNSTFAYNFAVVGDIGGGGAFVADNSSIIIKNSAFIHNYVTGNRAWGGAVITYNSTATFNNCVFINNTVIGENGKGGAIYSADRTNMTLVSTSFMYNSVTGNGGYGGALIATKNRITGYDMCFVHNMAATGVVFATESMLQFSGKTNFSQNIGSWFVFSSNVTFSGHANILNNSDFSNSSFISEEGGAMTAFQSNIVFIGLASLKYNRAIGDGGAIAARESKIFAYGNVTIEHNVASLSGGGIYVYQSELNFEGQSNVLLGNTAKEFGGGIHAIGSITRIYGGSVHFISNNARKGGGMSLMLNAKLYIMKTTMEVVSECNPNPRRCNHLEFVDNLADYGGALFVSDNTNTGNCESVTGKANSVATLTECFFQALALHPYQQSFFINLYVCNTFFKNNSATVAGSSLYGGLLDRCTVSPAAEIFKKYPKLTTSTLSTKSYFLNVTSLQEQDFDSTFSISSDSVRVCFCRGNNQIDCSYIPPSITVKKGETLNVSLVAVDQDSNTKPNSIVHGFVSLQATLGEKQSIQQTSIDGSCTELMYNVLSPHHSEQLHLYSDGPCMGKGISTAILTVSIKPCPVGFIDTGLRCDCDPRLYPEYVSHCSIDKESVMRRKFVNAWFAFVNNTEHEGYIIHRHCPFDYCCPSTEEISVNLNIDNGANALCAFNHSGKLCGSCEDGLSLSFGSSRCMPCSNDWVLLIFVFALVGIVLVAFILIFNLTVVTGTINGLTLYANIIAANRAIFIPFDTPNILTVFIAWLNLDFGFETCFFDGLDGYVKVWLQLVFPLYILFLVALVILLANRYHAFARILLDRNPVATLATLILLSYTKFIRIIITALSFTSLDYSDGYHELVWLFDANVPYLKGKHIPLFIVTVFVLALGLVYTLLVLSWQWIMRCQLVWCLKLTGLKLKVNTFMDAYHAPYHRQHRYWTGFLLLVRVMLYLISALNVLNDPSINLIAIVVCLVGVLFLLNNPANIVYKSWVLNVLESSYIINLTIFASVTLYIRESNGNQAALAYTSTSIAFVTFLATVFYHMYEYVFTFKKAFKWLHCFSSEERIRGPNHSDNQCHESEISDPVPVTEIDAIPVPLYTDDSPVDTETNMGAQETKPVVHLRNTSPTNSCSTTKQNIAAHDTDSTEDTCRNSSANPKIDFKAATKVELQDVVDQESSVSQQLFPQSTPYVPGQCSDEFQIWGDESTPLLSKT